MRTVLGYPLHGDFTRILYTDTLHGYFTRRPAADGGRAGGARRRPDGQRHVPGEGAGDPGEERARESKRERERRECVIE